MKLSRMKNLPQIATRLRFIVSHSSIRCTGNCLSRKFATSQEKPLEGRSKNFGPHLSENVSKAIESIKLNRVRGAYASNTLYLMDELAAKKFTSLIIANRMEKSSHVIEINPGLGFLTTELLDAGISSIHIFEGTTGFIPNLNSLSQKYPNQVYLEMMDFCHLWKVAYADRKDNSDNLSNYFKHVVKKSWKEEPAINIIGSLADINFIHHLVSTVIHQNFLTKYGRMVLYIAVPPSVWGTLTCTNEHYDLYRPRIVLFQTFFRYELLGSLPRTAFFPAYRSGPKKKRRSKCRLILRQNDVNTVYVVKIEAKPDVFDEDFTQKDLLPFYYFVKHHLRARRNRVIPALEHWIPGCGRALIAQGYNIYTEFGELLPQDIFKLFKEFRSWPGYKRSSFESCVDSFFERMDKLDLSDESSNEVENMFKLSVNQDETLTESGTHTEK